MRNEYEVRGEVTAIFLESPKYGRMEALISTKRLLIVDCFAGTWSASWNPDTESFYVTGWLRKDGTKRGSTLHLHKWIMKTPEGKYVDHINHDTLDNRDSNLRISTASENGQNRKGNPKNNTSGMRGVYWHKKTQRWNARFRLQGKAYHVGSFTSFEEAASAVVEARKKHMPFSNESA